MLTPEQSRLRIYENEVRELKKEKAVQFTVKSRLIVPDAKLLAEMVAASKAADEERGRHQGVKRAE